MKFDHDKYRDIMEAHGIDTSQRRAMFLAQCDHESQGFTRMSENLNYSAAALTATWPTRFPPAIALKYARQPMEIAERAYGGRMGNGPEGSGDGWRYRGAGFIQLTGHDNQKAFADHVSMVLADVGAYLRTEKGAMESACWFWKDHGCNELADTGSVEAVTKVINCGLLGLAEREELYKKYLA